MNSKFIWLFACFSSVFISCSLYFANSKANKLPMTSRLQTLVNLNIPPQEPLNPSRKTAKIYETFMQWHEFFFLLSKEWPLKRQLKCLSATFRDTFLKGNNRGQNFVSLSYWNFTSRHKFSCVCSWKSICINYRDSFREK